MLQAYQEMTVVVKVSVFFLAFSFQNVLQLQANVFKIAMVFKNHLN